MIYLSGCPYPGLHRHGVGYMLTPEMANRLDLSFGVWAADTGCFANPDGFSMDRYVEFLKARRRWRANCLFVTAPDRVGDWEATLALSLPALRRIESLGFPPAFIATDDQPANRVPWGQLEVLFIGGSDNWNLRDTAAELIAEAIRRDVWVHVGRVNSLRKLRIAQLAGASSADGTFIKFAPDLNVSRMRRWLDAIDRQPPLHLSTEGTS